MPINQETISVIVFIPEHRIKGTIYVHQGGRISDFLNVANKNFIPLSNVRILSGDGTKLIYKVPFMNLNKNYIIAMFPAEDATKEV